jgi:hypothetical protein
MRNGCRRDGVGVAAAGLISPVTEPTISDSSLDVHRPEAVGIDVSLAEAAQKGAHLAQYVRLVRQEHVVVGAR